MSRYAAFACLFSLIFGFAAVPAPEAAETDSAVYVEVQAEGQGGASERWKLYGSSHALVIGIDEYSDGWPRLSNAVKDAEAVAAELEARGFEVTTVLNPTGDKLRIELRSFFALKGSDPDARLFVWFAGHGYSEFGEGYLVPTDAPDPSKPEFRLTALHMGDVGSMVRIARSKHVYAVFDSCFAGTIFNASRARPPAAITRAVTEPVRQFLTSGDADQEVSDDGSFRRLFLKALNGDEDADANDDGYLTGTELSLYLEDRVVNLTNSAQTPRSGKLRDQRFDQGDFVFLLPQEEQEVQVAAVDEEAPAGEAGTRALPRSDPELAVELAFWDAIKTSESVADYEAYLTAYPEGRFAILAETRIAGLEARAARLEAEQARAREEEARLAEEARRIAEEEAAREAAEQAARETQVAALSEQPEIEPAEQDELALGLSRSDRRELQEALTALGFDTRGIDGVFGPGTRNAIKGYQASKGVEQTGFLTASLAGQLIAEAPKPAPEPEPAPQSAQQTAMEPEPKPASATQPATQEPANTQTAALPSAPAVSKEELERYIANSEHEVLDALGSYNSRHRVIMSKQFGGTPLSQNEMRVIGWHISELSGDEAVLKLSYKERRGAAAGGDTVTLLTRWTGSNLEFIGHQDGGTLRRTAGGPQVPTGAEKQSQTQTAALPPEPAVSERELTTYIDNNGSAMKAALESYNQAHRVILHPHGTARLTHSKIVSWRVVEISGNEAVVAVTVSHQAGSASGREVQRFLTKWTGAALEFIGYEEGREMIRTGG